MTQSNTLSNLTSSASQTDLLRSLKDLKNGVIGNTWKKVEVAEDEDVLQYLLKLLVRPLGLDDANANLDSVNLELVNESAVIIGALANVGSLTLRPLLHAGVPVQLLHAIKSLIASPITPTQLSRSLAPLLRALRNVLVSTADFMWGHMWGVGAEKKVVGTGLVGEEAISESVGMKGKTVTGKSRSWRIEATRALSLCFEQSNLRILLTLIHQHQDTQTSLPLYQLFARLIALPSHREVLARWSLPTRTLHTDSSAAGPSIIRVSDDSDSTHSPQIPTPFILDHLLRTITISASNSAAVRKSNAKILEAALDLLAALVKGQQTLSAASRSWTCPELDIHPIPNSANAYDPDFENRPVSSGFIELLSDLLTGPTAVRIAATNCLTNLIKADKGTKTSDRVRTTILKHQLLEATNRLFQTEGLEERVKLCFVLAALVSDDGVLQKFAADFCCPTHLITMVVELERDEEKGEIGSDLASRSKEAAFLALAALSFSHEPTRSLLAETSPPFLPHLHKALSHPSYGVRAAACQLARALSRTVAILRTSLVDSGVGEEVIQALKREVVAHRRKTGGELMMDGMIREDVGEDDGGDRAWTVEVAATATICNLIADFSPLKATLLRDGGIELLCELTHSPYEPLALNAMWALKNLTFHALESLKSQVMAILGWNSLESFIDPSTATNLRVQALEITQNILADALPSEVARTLDLLGDSSLLDILAQAAKEGQDVELRIPALFVLSNLALGNEKTRNAIVSKVEILEVLSEAMNAKVDPVKVPAIRAIRHLVESNAKTHRPRQAMLDLLQPYQLKPRLRELAESSPSLEVCQGAVGLLEILERGKETSGSVLEAAGSH